MKGNENLKKLNGYRVYVSNTYNLKVSVKTFRIFVQLLSIDETKNIANALHIDLTIH